jgi:hypothetical protein
MSTRGEIELEGKPLLQVVGGGSLPPASTDPNSLTGSFIVSLLLIHHHSSFSLPSSLPPSILNSMCIHSLMWVTGGFTASVAHRPSFAHAEIKLSDDKQRVLASAGSMLWMDGNMHMETGCHNGCCTAYCRTCSGEV